MRITRQQLQQIIKEELDLHEGSLSLRKDRSIPLFDEERAALNMVHRLASLYDDLQGSPHTDGVMEMEDARAQMLTDLKGQKVGNSLYAIVGMAKAAVQYGLRSASPERKEAVGEESAESEDYE